LLGCSLTMAAPAAAATSAVSFSSADMLSAFLSAFNSSDVPADMFAPSVRAVSLCGELLEGGELLRREPEKLVGLDAGRFLLHNDGVMHVQKLTEEVHILSATLFAMSAEGSSASHPDDDEWRLMRVQLTVQCSDSKSQLPWSIVALSMVQVLPNRRNHPFCRADEYAHQ
jgi:hypothetical protein